MLSYLSVKYSWESEVSGVEDIGTYVATLLSLSLSPLCSFSLSSSLLSLLCLLFS